MGARAYTRAYPCGVNMRRYERAFNGERGGAAKYVPASYTDAAPNGAPAGAAGGGYSNGGSSGGGCDGKRGGGGNGACAGGRGESVPQMLPPLRRVPVPPVPPLPPLSQAEVAALLATPPPGSALPVAADANGATPAKSASTAAGMDAGMAM